MERNAGGGERIERQVEYLATHNPDVIALQEVFVNTDSRYRGSLRKFGYGHAISSFEVRPDCHAAGGKRGYGELVLSKWPLNLGTDVAFIFLGRSVCCL